MTDYKAAIENRRSRRCYRKIPLTRALSDTIRGLAAGYSEESGVSFQVFEDDPEIFSGFSASYGMFQNVYHYIAVTGSPQLPYLLEKAGYFGEKLVLDLTALSLGTCWVGGTYKKSRLTEKLALKPEDRLICVIPFGFVSQEPMPREKLIARLSHGKGKALEQLYTAIQTPPERFIEGIRAVQRAPSAFFKQPVQFTWRENGETEARVSDPLSHEGIDLGIAMLHFEIGSETENRFEPEGVCWRLKL